jgi:hypothetical protein
MAGLRIPITPDAGAFTWPGSRLLVQDEGQGRLRVARAVYEQAVADCVVLTRLGVRPPGGEFLPVTAAYPHRLDFAGRATCCFAGPEALSLGGDPDLDVVAEAEPGETLSEPLGDGRLIELGGPQPVITTSAGHTAHESAAAALWREWLDCQPPVAADLRPMTELCWWTLWANTVQLAGPGETAVVPSKLGYVAAWQWDAYFIAVGLRHGAPGLARDQLSLVLRPAADGQLPDVVHDTGALYGSADLPPGDRAALRRSGSAAANLSVPLTKPPLAAWAAAKLATADPDQAWLGDVTPVIARSTDWWFRGGGLPVYDHPYSSGLDNSPVFDGLLPVTTPDLPAYLVLQDRLTARFADSLGDVTLAARCRDRADRTLGRLLGLWDPRRGAFRCQAGGRDLPCDTILGLLPLVAPGLPPDVREGVARSLDDPARYGLAWPVPTVSAADPAFDPEAMWRGPVWLATNYLLIDALAAVGDLGRARRLAERTLDLVTTAGGPFEYFNPVTAQRAARAVPLFSWSAALFVDLAVAVSGAKFRRSEAPGRSRR